MARRGTGSDNHAVSDAGFTLNVKCNDILTFKIMNLINNELFECFTLQKVPPLIQMIVTGRLRL